MAGNVWEWVVDSNGASALRGGSFKTPLNEARCALSKQMEPQDRSNDIGFRIVQETST
jgi:formylglycine-generating enzyme required for sulfatase activity